LIGRQVAISLDGQVLASPINQSKLSGAFGVSGSPELISWVWLNLTGHLPDGTTPTLPPTNDSPEQVVRSYFDAVNRHDLATVMALLTAYRANSFSQDDNFTNVVSISKLNISAARDQSSDSRVPRNYRQIVEIPIRFNLQQHRVESRYNGQTSLVYLLARNSDSQPWRILAEQEA
jgi:hypothetical protein